jgi:hypothetical protein
MLVLSSCEENLADPGGGDTVIQGGLTGLSVDASTVRFGWSAVHGVPDSAVLGYLATWPGGSDSLPPTARAIVIDSLLPGGILFTIQARLSGGTTGPAASIRWAPAARFDDPLTLLEYYATQPQRPSGLDLGGTTSNPTTLSVDPADPTVGLTLDLYLYGGEGEISDPLRFRSADFLVGSWNHTYFSTIVDSSSTLDLPLARFPAAESFTLDAVPITQNSIVYARVTGNEGDVHYVRIHIGDISGSGRTRSVQVRISLQRVVGLLYALCGSDGTGADRTA